MPDDTPKKKRGGARKGAGRKKGVPTKFNQLLDEKRAAIIASGNDPVDFLIAVMQDPEIILGARLRAAESALPYVRPRLAQVENTGSATVKHEFAMSDNEFARRIALILTGKAKA